MRFILLSTFLVIGSLLFAQDKEYELLENISYYGKSQTDSYALERCKLDIYYPKNHEGFPTIVWFHGGGLKQGNKHLPEALMEQGFAVVPVNYRLYPKGKTVNSIEDAAAAVAWVFNNIENYGGSPDLIFISGHSAGGYLTSMVGLDKQWLARHDIDANDIAGLIPFSGQVITHMTVREEMGVGNKTPIVDKMAPLYHVRADAPPYLIITGNREMELLGRYEENAYMMRMMKLVGHKDTRIMELDGYGHGMTYPAFPILRNEVRRIVKMKKK